MGGRERESWMPLFSWLSCASLTFAWRPHKRKHETSSCHISFITLTYTCRPLIERRERRLETQQGSRWAIFMFPSLPFSGMHEWCIMNGGSEAASTGTKQRLYPGHRASLGYSSSALRCLRLESIPDRRASSSRGSMFGLEVLMLRGVTRPLHEKKTRRRASGRGCKHASRRSEILLAVEFNNGSGVVWV